jgi:hypothetical protein
MRNVQLQTEGFKGLIMSEVVWKVRNSLTRQTNDSAIRTMFTIDCREVDWFTSESLALLARTRRELSYLGHELKLTNYSAQVAEDMIVPLFTQLLGEEASSTIKANFATRKMQAAA